MRPGPVTSLRGLAWLRLSDLGAVGTATILEDSGGGGTASWTYATAVPCRIDPLAGGEGENADRISDRSTHLLTFPPETDVSVSQRIQITGKGSFEVLAVRDATDEFVRVAEVVKIS